MRTKIWRGTHKGCCHDTIKGKTEVLQLQAKKCKLLLAKRGWKRQRKIVSFKETWPCGHLDFGLLDSRTVKEYMSSVLNPLLCNTLFWQSWETNHCPNVKLLFNIYPFNTFHFTSKVTLIIWKKIREIFIINRLLLLLLYFFHC